MLLALPGPLTQYIACALPNLSKGMSVAASAAGCCAACNSELSGGFSAAAPGCCGASMSGLAGGHLVTSMRSPIMMAILSFRSCSFRRSSFHCKRSLAVIREVMSTTSVACMHVHVDPCGKLLVLCAEAKLYIGRECIRGSGLLDCSWGSSR